jgi:cytochrome oxidase Cu insertion factor (SCO1/SenC/PrrC family)
LVTRHCPEHLDDRWPDHDRSRRRIPDRRPPRPSFTLADQFGRPVSFSSLHGREVALAFIDSRCTTVCPLTAEIPCEAQNRLGPADSKRVALMASNANPTSVLSGPTGYGREPQGR